MNPSFYLCVAPSKKRISELRDRLKRRIADDDDEKCMDELRGIIESLEKSPKAIIEYNHKRFKGIVERAAVEQDTRSFEIKRGIVFTEVIGEIRDSLFPYQLFSVFSWSCIHNFAKCFNKAI